MTITVNNYLDFQHFIINELIGDVWLTFFLGLILLIFFGIAYKGDIETILGLCITYSIIFVGIFFNLGILIIVILLVTGVSGFIISKKLHG